MKKTTTLLLSLLALTHTSNIQALGYVLDELGDAITDEAKKAVDAYTGGKLTDLENCAKNNFSSDACQDYLSTICADIKNTPQYKELKGDTDDWAKHFGESDCKDAFTAAQKQNDYVGLCKFEDDLCSLT